jgi:excisionase family DNA binding protein
MTRQRGFLCPDTQHCPRHQLEGPEPLRFRAFIVFASKSRTAAMYQICTKESLLAGFGHSVGSLFRHGAWWQRNFLPLADSAVVGGMSISTSHDGLLDIDGLADRLGVGERFVRRLVEERRIPYLKIGRLVRFDAREVEEWISSRRIQPTGPIVVDRHRRHHR